MLEKKLKAAAAEAQLAPRRHLCAGARFQEGQFDEEAGTLYTEKRSVLSG